MTAPLGIRVQHASSIRPRHTKASELLLSAAVCAFVASGVLTAQPTEAQAQQADPDIIKYHTGALSLGKPKGGDARLDNSEAIDLKETVVGTAEGAKAIRVNTYGVQYPDPGGPAGNITINQSGNLSTSNSSSNPIVSTSAALHASSTGGKGLDAHANNHAHGTNHQHAGDGGSGGDIVITNSGNIVSNVKQTYGIHAATYGGEGGHADPANSHYHAALGGKGGRVTLVNQGDISTTKAQAAAIVLQSLGGPGGQDLHHSDLKSGDKVSLTLKSRLSGGPSTVSTLGERSSGIVAQSVGGGDITYDLDDGASRPVSGGTGGEVEINLGSNSVSTAGSLSHGVVGQSIGGSSGLSAKGRPGSHGGDASTVTLNAASGSTIETKGMNSDGALLQSIGGSGGTGGFENGSVAVGGDGGSGGHGGMVDVEMLGKITTKGDHSLGVLTQSIGGGGGRGGNADAKGTFNALAIGGDGGDGGHGGKIDITVNDVVTEGLFSHAISALTVGGGGGHGGTATARATAPILSSATAVGGAGGKGGHGGEIDITADGQLTTSGAHSLAVLASSIGGGGGNGGAAHDLSASLGPVSLAVSVGVGGHGGSGGDGGKVTLEQNLKSLISTGGAFSVGLAALSIGGGGGAGGGAQSLSASVAAGEGAISGSVAVAIGGRGGDGGNGGAVSASSDGSIATKGDFALGVHALSAGGGGGHGGASTALSAALSTGMSASVAVAVGGSGGEGGHADSVSVDFSGASLITQGEHASAIIAQSIGGGGGSGGNALSLGASVGLEGNGNAISVGVGGSGGKGGNGGYVSVSSAGALSTSGSMSNAVLAQSIGGGGGSGGNSVSVSASLGAKAARSLSTSIGGNGKSAGHGGEVSILTSGQIMTAGQFSMGLAAQSIGGSGGIGGNSESASVAISAGKQDDKPDKKPGGKTVTVSVGGNGGDGGNGGAINITNGAALTTQGDVSVGILAQSVGGGGGAGGHADSIFLTGSSKTPVDDDGTGFSLNHLKSMELALGGNGGDGGDGGAVEVTHHYQPLTTYGDGAAAILAQSIGGGGGLTAAADHLTFLKIGRIGGQNTAGHGSKVTVDTHTSISTTGLFASGIIAQSLGGGGGALLSAENLREQFLEANDLDTKKGDVRVGGLLTSGKGGRVTVDSGGDIDTSGNFAAGIIAQSIGGGGGLATIDNADSETYVTVSSELGTSSTSHNGAEEVSINQAGAITTSGIGAIGIVAQSIGGGGGLAQVATALIDETDNNNRDAARNKNEGGGSAGKVSVSQTANALIHTTGNGAVGIFAQTIGGTGGLIQQADGKLTIHNHKTAGTGGDITISQNGILKTEGLHADGIYAIAHGSDTLGAIDITINGTVQTLGSDSDAVVAVSTAAGDRSGDIAVKVSKGGRVLSAGAKSDAVVIEDTTTGYLAMASITNSGHISADDGLAIRSNQYVHITNDGTLGGDIDVTAERDIWVALPFKHHSPVKTKATTAGYLYNSGSAVLETGSSLDLGTYRSNETMYGVHVGLLENAGTLSPGGGKVQNTQLSGRYQSSDTTIYAVDLNMGLGTSDHFSASQGAVVKGVVKPTLLSFGSHDQFEILSTPEGTLSSQARSVSTPVVQYSLAESNTSGSDDVLNLKVEKIDFAAEGLSSNEAAIAKTLNTRLAGGQNNTDSNLLAVANAPTLSELSHLLGSFSDPHAAKQTASLQTGATHFTGSVFSCGVANGTYAAIAETECDWTEAGYRWTEHHATADSAARDESLFNLGLGVQREISQNWRLGVAAGYGILDSTSDLAASQAKLAQAGLVAKYQKDNYLLGGSIAVGHSWQDMVRAIPLSPGTHARATTQSSWIHSRLRAAYLFEIDEWFAKPLADLDFNFTHTNGYAETGAGIYNLSVLSSDDFQVSAAAGMELGRSYTLSPDLGVRVYGYGGVRYTPDNTTTTKLLLSGTTSPVAQISRHDDYLGEFSAGMKFFGQNGMGFDVRYDGAFSKSVTSQSIKGKLRWRF